MDSELRQRMIRLVDVPRLRQIATVALLFAILPVRIVWASQEKQPAGAAEVEFQALLTRVRQSEPSVDFLHLRRLYAESDSFFPYRDDAEEAMVRAAVSGQHDTALKMARDILARDYMNIEAHFASMVSCSELKDQACAEHHTYVVRGMIGSILDSGDGKTPARAFVVVKSPEEYAVLRILGLRPQGQSLTRSDGHVFDVLTARDGRTDEEHRVYFNVDIAMAATSRIFGLR
jgi:hypothetical protein